MNEPREGASRKEGPEETGIEKAPARDLAVAPEMLAPETLRVEGPRKKAGERRRGGVAEEKREGHSGAGVGVDHARGVPHAQNVSRERAVMAEQHRLGEERGPGNGREAVEVPREGGALSRKAREQPVEIVVGLLDDRSGRQRGEVDEPSLDARQADISSFEEMEDSTAGEMLAFSREGLPELRIGRCR